MSHSSDTAKKFKEQQLNPFLRNAHPQKKITGPIAAARDVLVRKLSSPTPLFITGLQDIENHFTQKYILRHFEMASECGRIRWDSGEQTKADISMRDKQMWTFKLINNFKSRTADQLNTV